MAYKNYDLLEIILKHMNDWVQGDYRLFIADNTPLPDIARLHTWKAINDKIHVVLTADAPGDFEGLSHGNALDYLKGITDAPIIATMDPDFFWLNPTIMGYVEQRFADGYEAVGCAGWYPDWLAALDPRHPDRAGHLAPVVWGQFLSREVALADTFSVLLTEMGDIRETGWRVRENLIKQKSKMDIFPGFKYENQIDPEVCFFGTPEQPMGMHVLKGTVSFRPVPLDYGNLSQMVEQAKERWN